jgi:hypothetical protein
MSPTVGRIVHYRPKPDDPPGVLFNGPEFLPAIVTQVDGPGARINLKVFCDGPGIVHMVGILAGDAPGQWQWPKRE